MGVRGAPSSDSMIAMSVTRWKQIQETRDNYFCQLALVLKHHDVVDPRLAVCSRNMLYGNTELQFPHPLTLMACFSLGRCKVERPAFRRRKVETRARIGVNRIDQGQGAKTKTTTGTILEHIPCADVNMRPQMSGHRFRNVERWHELSLRLLMFNLKRSQEHEACNVKGQN